MELGKVINHNITIQPTANKGFYVKVGCGRFAFSSRADMLAALTDYLHKPEHWEKQHNEIFGPVCEAPTTDPEPGDTAR